MYGRMWCLSGLFDIDRTVQWAEALSSLSKRNLQNLSAKVLTPRLSLLPLHIAALCMLILPCSTVCFPLHTLLCFCSLCLRRL